MIRINTVIDNLKTYLETLTWTSLDGGGTTELNAVYTYENWANESGVPFAVILDGSGEANLALNEYFSVNRPLEVHFAINWSKVEGQSDDSQKEEAMVALREATDAFRENLIKNTTMTTILGASNEFIGSMSWADSPIPELNILRRIFTINILEIVQR